MNKFADVLVRAFIVFQVIIGGLSGILIGAILLNTIAPGHPFYVAIRGWLREILL